MENEKNQILAGVVFSAILISGSLIFLGYQISQNGTASVSSVNEDNTPPQAIAPIPVAPVAATPPFASTEEIVDDDAFLGKNDAPVVIAEFSDFQCPYCRNFYNETLGLIKTNYIDTGKVKFVYRDFPLSFHDGSIPAAMATECARDQDGDKAFFEMHDKIFDGQNLLGSGTVSIPTEDLKKYAEELDLNIEEFNECFDGKKFDEEIAKDAYFGQKMGITGTPGFLINGSLLVGAQPYSSFETAIEEALKKIN